MRQPWMLLAALLATAAPLIPASAQQARPPVNTEATRNLFDAIFANDLAAVQAAVTAGADLQARNDWGLPPIDLAVDKGYFEIAHYLLDVRNFRRQQQQDARPDVAPADSFTARQQAPFAPLEPGAARAAPAPGVRSGPLPAGPSSPAGQPAVPSGASNPFDAPVTTSGVPAITGRIQGPDLPEVPSEVPQDRSRDQPAPGPQSSMAPPAPQASSPSPEAPAAEPAVVAPQSAPTADPPTGEPVADMMSSPSPESQAPPSTAAGSEAAGGIGGFFARLAGFLPSSPSSTGDPGPEQEATKVAATEVPEETFVAAKPQAAQAMARMPVFAGRLGSDKVLGQSYEETARSSCVRKRGGLVFFCIEPVAWPAEVAPAFDVSTVMYQGSHAVVRYDGGTSSALYALFDHNAFDQVAAWARDSFGPPTATASERITVPGEPPLEGQTLIWQGVDSRSQQVTTLEVRSIDNSRSGFPDRQHGAVQLYREGGEAIFPQLSAIDLMLLR